MLYHVVLCTLALAYNAIAYKELDDNNVVVKEWHIGENGGFHNTNDLHVNVSLLDDEFEDVDDKHKDDNILAPRIIKGFVQWNMALSPWAACIVKVLKLPLKKNFGCGCGGTVIGRRHVLSAAHCVRTCTNSKCPLRSKVYYVVVGQIFPRRTKRFEKVKRFHFLSRPPGSTRSSVDKNHCFTNDIVVLELEEPIPFGNNVQSIALPPPASFDSKMGTTVTTRFVRQKRFCEQYGWGWGGGTARGLKRVFSRIIDCDYPFVKKTSCARTRFCTQQYAEIGGPCAGDSGGPLVCDGVLHGVITGHWGKCGTNNREVYQRVEVFVDWIERVMAMDDRQ